MQILNDSYLNLKKITECNSKLYQNALPFSHIHFDDFFTEPFLSKVLDEFPNLDIEAEEKFHDKNQEGKQTLAKYEHMGEYSKTLISFLNSSIFLSFLQQITGIKEPLIGDPYLDGGGFHETKKGGFLNPHIDFNKHPLYKLHRRVNVLVYLNKNWKEGYDGELELWNENSNKADINISPIFNRLVIFNTNSNSFHGHSKSLNCPDTVSRKSIALYYYSNGRPEHEIIEGLEEHYTIFNNLNDKENAIRNRKKQLYFKFLKRFIPPILIDILKWKV